MPPLPIEHLQQLILEKLDQIENRQSATARAVRSLAEGLTRGEKYRQNIGERLSSLEGVVAATGMQGLERVSAHDLADSVPPEVINKARSILWDRHNGKPDALPEPPDSNGQHHHHRKDDSITFEVDKAGDTRLQSNIKIKTLAAWGVAAVLGALHVWRMIADALHHPH